MKKIAFIAISTFMVASLSYAEGNIGCGLGTQVLGEQDSTLMQVFAATTNGTSGNQTFGISSGTLGCKKPEKFVYNEQVNKFVQANMDTLAVDIAKGQGETINNLAYLVGVQDTVAFAKKLQSQFDVIYSSENVEYSDVVDAIHASI